MIVPDSAYMRQVMGYGLTSAKIIYHLPDHPHILQEFIWQQYDLFPKFPALVKFVEFWKREIEGPLHSVIVSHAKLITPKDMRYFDDEFRLQ